MTFALPFRLTPDQDQKDIINGAQQNFEAITVPLNTNSFKIVKVGTGIVPAASVTAAGAGQFSYQLTTQGYNHDLGYVPAVLAYAVVGGVYYPLEQNWHNPAGGTNAVWGTRAVYVDATYIQFQTELMSLNLTASASEAAVKYYLLQETAT